MMLTRRMFIAQLSAIGVMSLAGTSVAVANSVRNLDLSQKVGLHLGCVQDELVSNPQQTIEFLQRIGIKHIELPDPGLLKRLHPILKGMGFEIQSAHFPSPLITGNWAPYTVFGNSRPAGINSFEDLLALAVQYDLKYLVIPTLFPEDRGDLIWYQEFAKQLNDIGSQCKQYGIQLCYHNHSFEFQPMEDTSPIKVMLEHFDHEKVKLELDIFWSTIAGIDIEKFITKYADYIALLQLGDVGENAPEIYRSVTLPQDTYQAIGQGKVEFDNILQHESLTTVPYFFLNLQNSNDIFNEIESSLAYLKQI